MLLINRSEVEVRYKETDQMGIVHHANYLVWFEIGRTKYMEEVGFKYAAIEEQGLISPVIDIQISYKKPVTYGETATIETWLEDYNGIRITYGYKIYNSAGELAVTGRSVHVVVKKDNFKPVMLKKAHPAFHAVYEKLVRGEK